MPPLTLSAQMVAISSGTLAPVEAITTNSRLVSAEAAPPRKRIGRIPTRVISTPPSPAPNRVMNTPKILLTPAMVSLL